MDIEFEMKTIPERKRQKRTELVRPDVPRAPRIIEKTVPQKDHAEKQGIRRTTSASKDEGQRLQAKARGVVQSSRNKDRE